MANVKTLVRFVGDLNGNKKFAAGVDGRAFTVVEVGAGTIDANGNVTLDKSYTPVRVAFYRSSGTNLKAGMTAEQLRGTWFVCLGYGNRWINKMVNDDLESCEMKIENHPFMQKLKARVESEFLACGGDNVGWDMPDTSAIAWYESEKDLVPVKQWVNKVYSHKPCNTARLNEEGDVENFVANRKQVIDSLRPFVKLGL